MVAQAFSKIFEGLFMFNSCKKLDKDVVRIRTMPQKPFRKLEGFAYGKKSTSIVKDNSTMGHKSFIKYYSKVNGTVKFSYVLNGDKSGRNAYLLKFIICR